MRLLIHLGDIHCVLHDLLPPIESSLDVINISFPRCGSDWTDHLEECEVGLANVIKRDLGVGPGQVPRQALRLVHHDTRVQPDVVFVETLEELPSEELDAHDGKHEPEDQADQQHVQYGGDGEHESVHHNLGEKL